MIKIVLEQQVSLASGAAVYKKVAKSINPLTPEHIEELGINYLRGLGVTRQKSSYILNIAREINNGDIDLKSLNKLKDHLVKEKLTKIKGIGSWTANIYLLMALRRPDIWPIGDIALENTVRSLMKLRKIYSSEKISKIAENWIPFRSVAARMLWHHYLSVRNNQN